MPKKKKEVDAAAEIEAIVGVMEVDEAVDEIMESISAIADDMDSYSQEESMEIYEQIADQCTTRARAIKEEIG